MPAASPGSARLGATRSAVDAEQRLASRGAAGSTSPIGGTHRHRRTAREPVVVVRVDRGRSNSRCRSANERSRCRGRIEEHVPVVERGDQPQVVATSSIPLPNTSPAMSPMPTTVKGSRCTSTCQLAEVPLHGLPGAAGGDAHRLVVVARRTTGGEGIAQPEPVLVATSLAMSENVAVPLSAATTR